MVVSRLVSRAISLDDRVTGALLPGYKKHVEPLAGLITAYSIPAISYIYADDDLMDQVKSRTTTNPYNILPIPLSNSLATNSRYDVFLPQIYQISFRWRI